MKVLCMLFLLSSVHAFSQVKTVKLEALTSILGNESDSVYVLNFWATWCKPCIEELPYFEEANSAFSQKNVHIILVSLDSPSELEKVLLPFVRRKELKSEILLLDEQNPNVWIDKIETEWTGSLPATIIQHNRTKKRVFLEKQLEKDELFTTIQSMME
jgi:thiol-disulfide isomerase/thioredoxin